MNVLLYPNLEKTNSLDTTLRACRKLREVGAAPLLDQELRAVVGECDCAYGPFSELLARCDVIMPVGGDGTVMRAARHAAVAKKPILAVNAGRLGFLTQVEVHELDSLARLVRGDFLVHRRMMLEAELEQGGRRRYAGLNDIVVSRGSFDRIVDIEVRKEGVLIARHRADGLIFATPTGSTAYSLSAGGPVVDPNMSMLLMTTICSHSTWGRSLVLPTDCEYKVTDCSVGNDKGLAVTVDGRRVGKIRAGSDLVVRKSSLEVEMVDLGLRSFYENVNEKLRWGR